MFKGSFDTVVPSIVLRHKSCQLIHQLIGYLPFDSLIDCNGAVDDDLIPDIECHSSPSHPLDILPEMLSTEVGYREYRSPTLQSERGHPEMSFTEDPILGPRPFWCYEEDLIIFKTF